ncbi:MAG: hypothetical protein Q8J78_06845, partial [Moraxellaceae bacterium]|nr:hypothetical protein [Moraxellaceae bacterium]
ICDVRRSTPPTPTAPPVAPETVIDAERPSASGVNWASLTLAPVEKEEAPEPPPTTPTVVSTSRGTTAPASPYAVSASNRQSNRATPDDNSSGGGKAAHVPDEVRGLSWGGFFMNWIWGLFNGSYIALLCFVPLLGFFVPFYLLFKGRELAWQNKRWDSVEDFNKVQRRWGIAGLVLTIIGIWSVYKAIYFVQENVTAEIEKQARMSDDEREAQRQEVLDGIEDPKLRQQMEQFYEQMDDIQRRSR